MQALRRQQARAFACRTQAAALPHTRSVARSRRVHACSVDSTADTHGVSNEREASLNAQCRTLIKQIEQAVRERESSNRRKRIAGFRHELELLMERMPAEESEALQAELRAERIQRSARNKAKMAQAMVEGPHIVIDCSFAPTHCRPGLESRSLTKQVEAAMAFNRRLDKPLALHCTDWVGECATFGKHIGAQNWPVLLHTEPLLEVFDAAQIIMLSPDAPEPMTEFDPSKTYVIGGIVDRTIRKGVTATYAEERGIRALRLPIAEHKEFLQMDASRGSSPVLNVCDVAIALCTLWQEGSWEAALELAVSQRKRKPQQVRKKRYRASNNGQTRAVASGEE